MFSPTHRAPIPDSNDPRVVMTLDAGGTSLRFSAVRGGVPVGQGLAMPTDGDDLARCLGHIVDGFREIRQCCPTPPVAISFAFPGPADYRAGIIGDLPNLSAFRGGVALGPMLEDRFGVPTFIHNDGSLFTYGEAIGGFLPYVNHLLAESGSAKRYRSLLGITLGTGLGGGIVCDGRLQVGDNSGGGQIWLLRNKLKRDMNAEEGACIRAVRRVYARSAGIAFDDAPEPKAIFEIASGNAQGDRAAALEAFRQLGEVAGDAAAQALTLIDGLAVVGGGVAGSWPFFLPALVDEMNGSYERPNAERFRRLGPLVFNLENESERARFLSGDVRDVEVPGSRRTVRHDGLARIGVGVTRLGTSEAIAFGAYTFALASLDATLA